jgi:quercetin dioxygenase-like cupin family protein
MRIVSKAEATGPGPDGDLEYFTGHVSHLRLHAPEGAHTSNVSVVCFDAGVRGSWHTHSGGQVIHVLEGEGLIQLRGEEPVRVQTGDTICIDAGEEHWHGAAEGSELAHMAISWGSIAWLEKAEARD